MPRCFALMNPVYGPAMRIIASITNAPAAVVTTTFDHGYVNGTIVRFDIPPALGMQQIDQMTAPLVVINATSFSVAINTTLFDQFSIPVGVSPQVNICGLCVPIGELSRTLSASLVNQLNPYRVIL